MTSVLAAVIWLGVSPYVLAQVPAGQAGGEAKRAPLFDDQFREENFVGEPAVAPDGLAVAFGISRPVEAEPEKARLRREDRTDIWLQARRGEKPRNLTGGASDGSGWWRPIWSPDGTKLLMMSTRGGRATPWIWERASGQLRQVLSVGLDEDDTNGGCKWVDEQRLVCLALEEDDAPRNALTTCPGYELAQRAWAKASRGEVTASVVSTETYVGDVRRLVTIDTGKPGHRVLGNVSRGLVRRTWWVAPAANVVVYVEPTISSYARVQQSVLGQPGTLGIVALDGRPLRLSASLPSNVVAETVQLSPGGTEAAFFAFGEAVISPERLYGPERAKDLALARPPTDDNPARLWTVNLRSGRVDEVPTGDVDLGREVQPPVFQWLGSGEWLFQAPRVSARAQLRTPAKSEWLLLNRKGQVRSLTFGDEQPSTLTVVERGKTIVGIAGQEVIRVDVASGKAGSLTKDLDAPVLSIMFLDAASSRVRAVVRTGKADSPSFSGRDGRELIGLFGGASIPGTENRLLDLDTGRVAPLPTAPTPTANLSTLSGDGDQLTAWFSLNDRTGSFLWRVESKASADLVIARNTYRQDVQRYEERVFDYTSANGEPLKALMVLPADYSPNRRYPVVVDSDIGYSQTTASSVYDLASRQRQWSAGLDPETFAAAGYVYIFASTPTEVMDSTLGRSNLLLWHLGVLPAVDKAIAMGVADPDRIVLYGGSSFGYGVYGIVTQTTRFKAAVATAGWVDQQSLSVSTSTCTRYMPEPFGGKTGPMLTRRQNSFWRDTELFRRNSPLTYVDRVQTPLMIVHGDGDFLPMEQAEMFYASLLQQRKTAMFVRYWGEGHGQRIPANLRDVYQRILAWFDRFADVHRDASGAMVFDGERVKSRGSAPPLSAQDFARFQPFTSVARPSNEQASRPE